MRRKTPALLLSAVSLLLGLVVAAPAASASLPAMWPARAHHWPVVIVEDHTAGKWSVKAAVARWHSGLRMGTCRAGAGCVRVFSTWDPTTNDLGDTNYVAARPTFGPGQFNYSIRISLDWALGRNYGPAVRFQTAMHELGHAQGLGHDRSGGVMWWQADGRHLTISSYERWRLRGEYGL